MLNFFCDMSMMELFGFRVKEDLGRRDRLFRIRKSIEASLKYEADALSKPLNASTLKRLYNIESLWVSAGGSVTKLGSASYAREMEVFSSLEQRCPDVRAICIDRGEKYHVLRRGDRVYAFSTPLELDNSDMSRILNEIERSLSQKKLFLSSDITLSSGGGDAAAGAGPAGAYRPE